MDKLQGMVKKELTEVENKGINASNLELINKLTGIYKDLATIKAMEEYDQGGEEMYEYSRYRDGYRRYNDGGGYRDGGYRDGGYRDGYEDYGRRGVPGSGRGRYNTGRMRDHMERMMDGMDQYEYGKERYMHSGDETRVTEGLEKLMYAMCMFVESAMDFAETPQEKEIIRKHVKKISNI